MGIIKDGRYPIVLDKERHLLFSLNVLDAIEERYGDLNSLGDKITSIREFKWLLTTLLNEGKSEKEEDLTEQEVGRLIHTGNLTTVKDHIFKAFAMGMTGNAESEVTEDTEEEEVKNA